METKTTLEEKKEEIQKELAHPKIFQDPQKIKLLSQELSVIEKKLEYVAVLEKIEKKREEAASLLTDHNPEIRQAAEEEMRILEKEKNNTEAKFNEKKDNLPDNVIMEIRAGAGGNEAALFARELYEMYSKFAQKKGWNTAIIDESKSDLGGSKEVVFEIAGKDAYKTLRFESGVHRVQRPPETEKMGRIHTSTASVAVLPKAREVDIAINPQDIRIEFYRSSGPGGQNVNKVETAGRITHIPTGLVVTSQD